jgi:hypothetical protein
MENTHRSDGSRNLFINFFFEKRENALYESEASAEGDDIFFKLTPNNFFQFRKDDLSKLH